MEGFLAEEHMLEQRKVAKVCLEASFWLAFRLLKSVRQGSIAPDEKARKRFI